MEESEDIKFAEVNCMDDDSLDTCTEEGVDGFPAVHLYKGGVLEDIFDGERTVAELANFVWQTVDPSRVEHNDAMDEYLNLASLMGGGVMEGGEGEEEFEECDCSDPECDCDDIDDTEDYDDVDYTYDDEESDGEDYEEVVDEDDTDYDYEDEEGEPEGEALPEDIAEDSKEDSQEATKEEENQAGSNENTEPLTEKLPESNKDEL